MDDDNLDKNKKLFPQKLWELIHDDRYQSCLRWSDDGQRVYLNRDEFEASYLKKPDQNQFNTQKAISFVRQMNMYGFKKVDDFYYENENFKRNSPDSLRRMIRRHPARNSTDFLTSHEQQQLVTASHHLHHHNNTHSNIIVDYDASAVHQQQPFFKSNKNNNFQTNNNITTTSSTIATYLNNNNNNSNNNNNNNNNSNSNTNITSTRPRIKDHQHHHHHHQIHDTEYILNAINGLNKSPSNHCSPIRSPTSPMPLTTLSSSAHSGSYTPTLLTAPTTHTNTTQPNNLSIIGPYDSIISSRPIGTTDEEIMQRGHWTLPQDKSMLTPEEVRRGQRINGVPCDKCPIIGCSKRVSPTNTYPALVSHLYGYHFSGFSSYNKRHSTKPDYCRLLYNSSWNATSQSNDRQIDHHQEDHQNGSSQNQKLSRSNGIDFTGGDNHKDRHNDDCDEDRHNDDEDDEDEDEDENADEVNDDDDDQYQEDSLNSYSPTLSNPNKRYMKRCPSSSMPAKLLKQHHQQQLSRQQQPQDLSNYSQHNHRLKNSSPATTTTTTNYSYNESSVEAAFKCTTGQPQSINSPSQLTAIISKLVKKICDQRDVKLEPEASLEAERFTEKLLISLIDDAAMIVEHQNESKSSSQSFDKSNLLIDASSLTLALKFMPSRLAAALSEKSANQIQSHM